MQRDADRHERRVRLRVLLLGAALVCGGCYTLDQAAPPVASLVRTAGPESLVLDRGRELYLTSCAKCHSPVPVRSYTLERWDARIIPEMASLTKLSAADTAALRSYVLAVLKEPAQKHGKD